MRMAKRDQASSWPAGLQVSGRVFWAVAIGLMAAAWLFPCEGAVGVFAGVPLAAGWILLGGLTLAASLFLPEFSWRWSWCDVFVFLLMVWTGVSTILLVQGEACFARAGLNHASQFLGFGFLYAFGRLTFLNADLSRGWVAFFVGAIAFLAAAGLYDYAVEMPETRRVYFDASEVEKQRMLAGAGIMDPRPESRERKLFEDRFRATEPLSTFAHTNSLATVISMGFSVLLGWIVLAVPVWKQGETEAKSWWPLVGSVSVLVLMAVCLVLTKSRTSWLAVASVTSAFVLYRQGFLRTLFGVSAAGAISAVLFGILLASGVLDILVLKEAAKSLWYRVEYWQSTFGMIGEHPVLGVGLGSFQDRYPKYQLPQASETVADPHNFLLEAAATLGLVGLLLVVAVLCWMVWVSRRGWLKLGNARDAKDPEPLPPSTASELKDVSSHWVSWTAGLVLGLFLATFLGLYSGLFPSLGKWLVGIPIGVLAGVLCYHKVPFNASMRRTLLTLGLVTWAINLLAAGGFTSWNVAQMAWLFLGGWVTVWDVDNPTKRMAHLSRWKVVLELLVVSFVGLLAWEYALRPTWHGWQMEQEAARNMAVGAINSTERILKRWHGMDPWSEAAWQQESQLAFSIWQQSDSVGRDRVRATLDELQKVRPDVAARYRSLANAFYTAYITRQHAEDLEEAMRLQMRVTELAPSDAIGYAQLAYWRGKSGDETGASQAAATALQLDLLNPHIDRALKNQFVSDGIERNLEENAEQICRRLRSRETEDD